MILQQCSFLSFFNFVMSLRWRRSLSTFSQIWRDSKHESRKSEVPFHIVGNCGDFWRFLAIFFLFLYFWRLKKQGICDRSFFFRNIFRKMAKIRHQKNRCCQGSRMVRSLLLKIVGRLSDYKQISTSPKSYSSCVVGLEGFATAKKKSFWSRICRCIRLRILQRSAFMWWFLRPASVSNPAGCRKSSIRCKNGVN